MIWKINLQTLLKTSTKKQTLGLLDAFCMNFLSWFSFPSVSDGLDKKTKSLQLYPQELNNLINEMVHKALKKGQTFIIFRKKIFKKIKWLWTCSTLRRFLWFNKLFKFKFRHSVSLNGLIL